MLIESRDYVRVVAQTDFKPIEETATQSFTFKLQTDKVQIPGKDKLSQTKSGALKETKVVSNPGARISRVGSLGGPGMTATMLFYAV